MPIRTTTSATRRTSASTPGAKPVFHRADAAQHIVLPIALLACIVVLVLALVMADRMARDSVTRHERTVATDIAISIDHILDGVRSRHPGELDALIGRPCASVSRTLAEAATRLRYLRAVGLVNGGRVTCSSALGPVDVPLDVYTRTPASAGTTLALLEQTPFQRGVPVLAVVRAATPGSGVLYLIEGDYVADMLAYGARFGAATATLSVAASQPYVSQVYRRYRLVCLTIALLVNGLVAAAYLLAMAPRRLLLKAVRHALKRGELHVVYQPIVDVETRRTVGVEALLRWQHPKWGAIGPAAFVPEVESSSILPKITEFVLRTAVSELADLAPSTPLRIAINIAPQDLERPRFVALVAEAIRRLPPGCTLVLEVTERVLLEKNARTTELFAALRATGAKFAIDDFGTHHSNLDLLSRFPFDYVKIDRQFISQLTTGNARLIEGIAALARHYDVTVIAEGVETEEQHRALRAVGVQYAQGFLYHRPQGPENLKRDFAAMPA